MGPWCLPALACLLLAGASSLQSQSTRPDREEVFRQWRELGADPDALSLLMWENRAHAGPAAFPPVVIQGVRNFFLPLTSHLSYEASSSIDPALKDSIRRRLLQTGSTDKDRGIRAVAHAAATAVRAEWRLACIAYLRAALASPQGSSPPSADCTDEAAVIAREWETPPADSAAMFTFLLKTQNASDLRVRDALMRAADYPGHSRESRVMALSALATLAHPAMNIFSPRRRQEPRCINWGWSAYHAVQQEGVVPLNSVHRAEIVDFLHTFGAKERDDELAWQGQFMASCIRSAPGGSLSVGTGE